MDFAPLEGLCGVGVGAGGESPTAAGPSAMPTPGKRAASSSPANSSASSSGDEAEKSNGVAGVAGSIGSGGSAGAAGFVAVGPDGDAAPAAKPAMSWAAVAKRSKTGP